MQCLIIDDDKEYIDLLNTKLKENYQDVEIDSFQKLPALNILKDDYDIIFLDIIINNTNGIDYCLRLKEKYHTMTVVFISNQNDFIFQTQKISPLCFIRKSHFEEDFQTFEALYEEKMKNNTKITFHLNHSMNNHQETYITLSADDIIYVECFSHELIIHTYSKEFVVKMSLKEFLNKVDRLKCFIQIHRAYAVNMNYVYRVEKDFIYMINDESKNEIRMSKKFRNEFMKAYKEYMLL